MFLKRSERASCGGSGTRGMFRSDEYEGGEFCWGGGWGVPKSIGAGDVDRECTERDVSSFMRLVLRTWRKRSVRSAARWLASLPGALGPCEWSMAVRDARSSCEDGACVGNVEDGGWRGVGGGGGSGGGVGVLRAQNRGMAALSRRLRVRARAGRWCTAWDDAVEGAALWPRQRRSLGERTRCCNGLMRRQRSAASRERSRGDLERACWNVDGLLGGL